VEVLQLLAEGRTGHQIAERLSLFAEDRRNLRARLVEKLGIRDVAGLCARHSAGIIPLD